MRTLYKKIKKKSKYYSPKKHYSHQKPGVSPRAHPSRQSRRPYDNLRPKSAAEGKTGQ